MKEKELVGEWFLPNSNLRLSGQLVIDYEKRRIELVLYGTHYIEGLKINLSDHNNHSEYEHDTILGKTHFESVTVINCKWIQSKPLGKDFYEVRYRGSLVLHRVHLNKLNDLRISKALVKFPYLSSWYDGTESPFKLDYKKNEVPNSTSKTVEVTKNLKLNFIDSFQKQAIKFGVSYQVDFEKLLEFEYMDYIDFDDLLKDVVRFCKLLEFSIRKRIQYKVFSITVDSSCLAKNDLNRTESGLTYVSITYLGSYKSELLDRHDIHQNYMLLSAWVLPQNELNRIIQKWYANDTYFPIYDYYLDSLNWFEGTGAVLTHVMFNNRFLNLIQALESYHKKIDLEYIRNVSEYNDNKLKVTQLMIDDEVLNNWFTDSIKGPPENFSLRERLQSLLLRLEPILKQILGNKGIFSSFPNLAKVYRHKLSHGDVEGVDQGRPLVLLYYEAQFILTLLILETFDLSENIIVKLIKHNQNCVRDINEIIVRLKTNNEQHFSDK